MAFDALNYIGETKGVAVARASDMAAIMQEIVVKKRRYSRLLKHV